MEVRVNYRVVYTESSVVCVLGVDLRVLCEFLGLYCTQSSFGCVVGIVRESIVYMKFCRMCCRDGNDIKFQCQIQASLLKRCF